MLRLPELHPVDESLPALKAAAAAKLGLSPQALHSCSLYKKSVDARRRPVRLVCTVDVELDDEDAVFQRLQASPYGKKVSRPQHDGVGTSQPAAASPVKAAGRLLELPVLVVGSGPAGLFAALHLARSGCPVELVERGADVESRHAAVLRFAQNGELNPHSNIAFGEGGAGTFSDGKLSTNIRDERCRAVLQDLVRFGAPEQILSLAKPHVGTDLLRKVVRHLRGELQRLGCQVHFETTFAGLAQGSGTAVPAAGSSKPLRAMLHPSGKPEAGRTLEVSAVVLAPGHSARDTFAWLYEAGFSLEQKPFSIGVRIEHLQEAINQARYGISRNAAELGPADYKLAWHADGRGVYSFCMCPGGWVVGAASEPGCLVTNGMSEHARAGQNANAALLVSVEPADFGSSHPLAGIEFQRRWERAAFAAGGGTYTAPATRVGDFLRGQPSKGFGLVQPSYKPAVLPADVRAALPPFAADLLRRALPVFGQRIRGFDDADAVLTAVESRSSSPVRIVRSDDGQSSVPGVFPCGEGAGYAGGIMSAAVDGLRAAERCLAWLA